MSKKLVKKATGKTTQIKQDSGNKAVVTHHQSKSYSGPIPKPSDLQKYEGIKIGFAERIITMAENETSHRHDIEHKIINSERIFNILGQMTALFMGVLVIALMGYAVSKGFADQVKWIGVSIAAAVCVFVYRRK